MPTGTDAGADTPAHANAGETANAEGDNLDAKINRALTNHMKRLEAKMSASTAELIKSVVTEALSGVKAEKVEAEKPADNPAGGERPTIKALEEKYRALEARLVATDKARQEAESSARDTRLRSEVRSKLAAAIDPKHLDVVMDSLYDARKRFALGEDGTAGVKFKRDGYEEVLPLEAGIKELVTSELKHFAPSRTGNLPPSGVGLRGNPLAQAQQANRSVNPIYSELARYFDAEGKHDTAAKLLEPSGTPQK